MKIKNTLLGIALCVAAPLALAQGYVGATGGATNWDIDCAGTTSCDKSGTGFKIFGGYMLNPNVGIEALYIDLGKATVAGILPGLGTATGEFKGSGFGIGGVLAGRSDAFSFGARLAIMSVEGKVNGRVAGFSGSTSKTSAQPLFGVYAGYEIVKNLDLRIEFDSTRVKVGDDDGSDGTVRLISGGITYRF